MTKTTNPVRSTSDDLSQAIEETRAKCVIVLGESPKARETIAVFDSMMTKVLEEVRRRQARLH